MGPIFLYLVLNLGWVIMGPQVHVAVGWVALVWVDEKSPTDKRESTYTWYQTTGLLSTFL